MRAPSRGVVLAGCLALGVLLPLSAQGFEVTRVDAYNQTHYVLRGPDRVAAGDEFTVTISVTDTLYASTDVASDWTFSVHSLVSDGAAYISLSGLSWSRSYTLTAGTVGTHTVSFAGTDIGHLGHHPAPFALSADVVVDTPAPVRATTWGSIKQAFR